MKKLILNTLVILAIMTAAIKLYAAVGCTLTDPDRDIMRIFHRATNYKTQFFTIEEHGGMALLKEVEKKLGDALDKIYETPDVPYAYYQVLEGKEIIGYVHGVNQKGYYGGMQLILATDLEGVIIDFYYQKLSSPEIKIFQDKSFTKQFLGLSLKDFYNDGQNRISAILDPSKSSSHDFEATLRGIKKNLILQDKFILENKYDEFFIKE